MSASRAALLIAAVAVLSCKKGDAPTPAPSTSGSASNGAIENGVVASTSVSATSSAPSGDIITHASPHGGASSATPPVIAQGSIDGAALRARNFARLNVPSSVTVLQGDSALELGKRICEQVVPQRPKDTPILLKPNIGGFDWFKDPKKTGGDDGVHGRTTDPEFVRGVIRCLKARGHTKITVAEGWGATHKDWEKLVAVGGYAAMTKDEGVPLVAMDDDGVFDVELDTPGKPVAITGMDKTHVPTLLMPKILADHLDHGMFISLPKVKTHRFGVISMSIKGMQGTVMTSDASPAFRQKWRMHRELNPLLDAKKKDQPEYRKLYVDALEKFAERMVDVLEIEAPDVVLAEGAPAMGGDGFQKLWPSSEKVAIGGVNAILVDRIGAQFLGLWHNESLGKELLGHTTSPLLEVAAKRFGIDIESPQVVGDGAKLLSSPRAVHYVSMAGFSFNSDGVPNPPVQVGAAPPIANPKTPNDEGEKPVAHAAPLGNDAITLDGRGDDAAWQRAKKVSFDTDYAGEDAGITTNVRFSWAVDALYALFELEQAGLNVDASQPTDVERKKLYTEDCVELFLSPDPQKPARYYEIELGPFGHFFDLDVDHTPGQKKNEDDAWSSGAKIATTHDAQKHTATIEVAFRDASIVKLVKADARFPLGLFRMEGRTEGKEKRSYLAWSPPRTKKPNFHVPEAFGALVLDR